MEDQDPPVIAHPMGERSNCVLNSQKIHENSEGIHCDTFAGLVHVEWDEQAPVIVF